MRRLADSGKEARVPSSLAGGTGDKSNEAAAAAEKVATFLADTDTDDGRGAAIRGLAAVEEASLLAPIVKRRVTLREELIVATKRGIEERRANDRGGGQAWCGS